METSLFCRFLSALFFLFLLSISDPPKVAHSTRSPAPPIRSPAPLIQSAPRPERVPSASIEKEMPVKESETVQAMPAASSSKKTKGRRRKKSAKEENQANTRLPLAETDSAGPSALKERSVRSPESSTVRPESVSTVSNVRESALELSSFSNPAALSPDVSLVTVSPSMNVSSNVPSVPFPSVDSSLSLDLAPSSCYTSCRSPSDSLLFPADSANSIKSTPTSPVPLPPVPKAQSPPPTLRLKPFRSSPNSPLLPPQSSVPPSNSQVHIYNQINPSSNPTSNSQVHISNQTNPLSNPSIQPFNPSPSIHPQKSPLSLKPQIASRSMQPSSANPPVSSSSKQHSRPDPSASISPPSVSSHSPSLPPDLLSPSSEFRSCEHDGSSLYRNLSPSPSDLATLKDANAVQTEVQFAEQPHTAQSSPAKDSTTALEASKNSSMQPNRVVFRCSVSVSHEVDSVFLCLNTVERVSLRGLCSISSESARFVGWPMRRTSSGFSCMLYVKSESDFYFGNSVQAEHWLSNATLPSFYYFLLLHQEEGQTVIETSSPLSINWALVDSSPSPTVLFPIQYVTDSLIDFSTSGSVLLHFVRLKPKGVRHSISQSSKSVGSISPHLPSSSSPFERDPSASQPEGPLSGQSSVSMPAEPSSFFNVPVIVGDPSMANYQVFNSIPATVSIPMNVAPAAPGSLSFNPPFVILENGQLCWCISPTLMCPGFSSVVSDHSSCVCSQTKHSKSLVYRVHRWPSGSNTYSANASKLTYFGLIGSSQESENCPFPPNTSLRLVVRLCLDSISFSRSISIPQRTSQIALVSPVITEMNDSVKRIRQNTPKTEEKRREITMEMLQMMTNRYTAVKSHTVFRIVEIKSLRNRQYGTGKD